MSSLDEKMPISELETITFYKGHLTNGRRLAPIQQIQSGFRSIQIVELLKKRVSKCVTFAWVRDSG